MHKKLIEGKKAILFDLDGTIVDTDILWAQAFETVLGTTEGRWISYRDLPSGATISQKWDHIKSMYKDEVAIKVATTELTETTTNEFLKLLQQDPPRIRNGFWNLMFELKEDKKLKTGLVTSSSRRVTDIVLSKLGITQSFDITITGDEVKRTKPDPEIYLNAAKMLKVKPRECLVFEDALLGAMASVRAGMDTIVVWNTDIPRREYPQEVLMFAPDFEGFAGNLDLDFDEYIKKLAEEALNPGQ